MIKLGRLEEYDHQPHPEEPDDSERDDDETEFIGDAGSPDHLEHCRNCPACVYLLMIEYNMFTNAFQSIGLAYKYLLSLSVTQVACERSFSALKLIKTFISSRLNQENLEALMLMKCNHEIAMSIETEFIIDKVVNHSIIYSRILKF